MARKTILPLALLFLLATLAGTARPALAAPDYSAWQQLLAKHYDPAKGMDYKALKAQDKAALDRLRQRMAGVDVRTLSRPDQLAYWINLYNISVVGIVVDGYPVDSIRDLSTDPIVRLNVFKKDSVATREGKMSLDDIEHKKVREGFKDARIHFAINCAAESCPPIRPEPYVGARIDQQLDDQARKFLNGPHGARVEKKGGRLIVHTTKIMDWFGEDFDKWGGGRLVFLHKYLAADKARQIAAAGNQVEIEYDDYSWKLNDASR
ncbi:MAG TPA: DUF547 domain-containing protein [Thermoanaerobaculia bacterium]|nr:DUF547 domain-containing protein [Thermoanaerobaculia bacterium]